MLIQRLLVLCAVGVIFAFNPASAAGSTTITNTSTTPHDTTTDGDITINSGAAVTINSAGAAVTANSNNFINNQGSISNTSATGAIAVELEGGGANAFMDSAGSISVTGKGASGGIGIEVTDSGFTGDIREFAGSTVTVTGDNSIGLAIFGPLIGNITLNGTVHTTGANAIGVLTTAAISGSFINRGVIETQGISVLNAKGGNPQSGSAVAIGGNLLGGFLNAGPATSDDTNPFAIIESQGPSPVIEISPEVATAAGGNAANITIGLLTDPSAVIADYSFVNRGLISTLANDPGVDALAILIEGDGGGHTTTLTGGLYNRGNIIATGNSGTKLSEAQPVDATAIEVGSGGILAVGVGNGAAFHNEGNITATTSGLDSGTATALLVDAGGTMPSLINAGTIAASAREQYLGGTTGLTLTACAICDASGTLSFINNAGTISASAGTIIHTTNNNGTTTVTVDANDGNTDTTTAVDVSHNSSGVIFIDTGAVNGNIFFGSGSDTLDVTTLIDATTHAIISSGNVASSVIDFGAGTDNKLIVDGSGTSVSGVIEVAGGGGLAISAKNGGAITFMTNGTNSSSATTLDIGTGNTGGTVTFVMGKAAPVGGAVLTTTGNATFDPSAKIDLAFDGMLPVSDTYTLLASGGTLTVPTATLNAVQMPWLYTGSVSQPVGTNDIVFDFHRKTAQCSTGQDPATCLGLNANQTAIFGPAISAALLDNQVGAALLNVSDVAQGKQALNALMPDINNDVRAMMIAITDQATGPVGARQRTLTEFGGTSASLQTWGQEFVNVIDQKTTTSTLGYEGRGFGFAIGADAGSQKIGRFGGGFTFFAGDLQQNDPLKAKTRMEWYMASLYSNWRGHVLFFDTQANAGFGSLSGARTVIIDTLTRKTAGNWSGYLASGGVSTGLILKTGSLAFIPLLNLDALYLQQNGYTEQNGGAGIDLKLGSQTDKSLRGYAGIIIRDDIADGNGFIQPELRAGWSHDFLDNPSDVQVSFVSVPGLPFTLTPPKADASRFVGGLGLSFSYPTWSAGFNYDATYNSGTLSHSGVITLTGRI